MSELQIYNSLERKKQAFEPIDPAHIRIYACGPTVYNYAHIGNARMAVVFDMLSRVLKHIYPQVTYVSNITDVDDKIMQAAVESGDEISDITLRYEKIYNDDMAALGVSKPDIQPRATDHISHMIQLIEQLIERGHAYEAEGHVLFNVPSFPAYGGLSGRSRDEQLAGARVDVAPYKKDGADFVLWKHSDDDQPGWESPWGRGRPGWHIECSAMAEAHLGLPFDIHGGGADLKFPHHENEIAQSCCAHGHDDLEAFSKYWVHNGFVTVEGEKMSKSLGNVVLAHDLLEQGEKGEVIRMALLSAQYRHPLDWSDDKLGQMKKLLDKIYTRLHQMAEEGMQADPDVPASIMDALYDDLNTPQAIAEINMLLKQPNSPGLLSALKGTGHIMGILDEDPAAWLGYDSGDEDAGHIEELIAQRKQARADKDFAKADQIRDDLLAQGIEIEDTPKGTIWRKAV